MRQHRRWVLYLFFPVTIYLFVGTTLFFLLYKLERLSERLGHYSQFRVFQGFAATEWHNRSIWLTALCPVVWPFLALRGLVVLFCAFLLAMLRFIYNILVEIWEWIVDLVTRLWNWTIDSIEYIWDEIRNAFS